MNIVPFMKPVVLESFCGEASKKTEIFENLTCVF